MKKLTHMAHGSAFFECLANGPTSPNKILEWKEIRIKSLKENAIFSVTYGRSKPS
jgi:hypothetical protein